MQNTKFSKIGYILSMAGSAIGLGTAWKFPTMVGQNGGFAFILLFVILSFIVGATAFLAEAALGKLGKTDAKAALMELAPTHKKFWSLGGFSCFTGLLVTSFYLVIVGWLCYYALCAFFGYADDEIEAKMLFEYLLNEDWQGQGVSFLIVFYFAFWVIFKGIKNGIERLNVFLLPALFVLLLAMLVYCAFFGNFSAALFFIFTPDFSKIFDADLILNALGLAVWSCSLGLCVVYTYANNTSENTNIFSSIFYIILLNLAVGVLMGLVVFSFVPISNATQGAGLIFISLASLFGSLGLVGQILGFVFFVALIFAGITSAVSMIEPNVVFLENNLKISRQKAITFIAIFVFLLGTACMLSHYDEYEAYLKFGGKSLFKLIDLGTANILMPLTALFLSIFIGWVAPNQKVFSVFENFVPRKIILVWYFLLRFIVPVAIISVGVYNFI